MKKKTRHFLNINELKSTDIKKIINQSHILKKEYGKRKLKEKKILAMIFEKPSTRTRVSFEVGMKQLDGDVVILDQADSQLGRGESLIDTIRVLNSYVDIIMYRGSDEKKLYEITKFSDVPIINGLTDQSHPCQILADIMTLEENFKNISNLNLCWVGDGNNVCNSWIHSCLHFGFNLNITCPKGFFPSQKLIDSMESKKINFFEDPSKAVIGADVLITDTWVSMGMKDKKKRLEKFKAFQINSKLMKLTKKKTFFLHCLPAHRGCEVTDEIIDGKNSLVWSEAENRLYVHQSILLWCLGKV
ncbi:MAG: ornithine carbamoyltransferase [Rickettsiales bacterium]|nr:ornithine carbamoyltransferase [Rickettsiales bacterium]